MHTYRVKLLDLATGVLVADLAPIKLRVQRQQNATGSYSFTVPVFMPNARKLEDHCRAYILEDGVVVMDGTVGQVSWGMAGDQVVYSISGNGELADLANMRPHSDSHYQNTSVTAILVDLLTSAPGWALGDISTMIDPAKTTTIDLREEEHLFPQIAKVIDSIPGNYYRYGGTDALGNRLLDIGEFGGQTQHSFAQHDPGLLIRGAAPQWGLLGEVQIEEDRNEILNEIEPYGGTVEEDDGGDYVISLADALAADPTLAADPDFPIVNLGGDIYVVRNTALYPNIGGGIRQVWDEHVPDDTSAAPTPAEIQEAGLALYEKTVSELRDKENSIMSYNATVLGLADRPTVGNLVHVHAHEVVAEFEMGFGTYQIVPGFYIDEDLRVNGWSLDVGGDKDTLSLQLTDGELVAAENEFVQLFDTLKPPMRKPRRGGSITFSATVAEVTVNVGPGVASDYVMANGHNGKLVTIPLPAAPGWATAVSRLGTPYVTPIGCNSEIVTEPALPATDLVIAIDYLNTNWDDTRSAVVIQSFLFSS